MHPRKKVLYVITKATWGGAQRYVYDLATAARDRGYDVAVAVGGDGPLVARLTEAGVRIIRIESMQQRRGFLADLLTFSSLFTLVRLFRDERPDIVHLNSAKAGGLGSFAARITGIPRIVFTAHGWEMNAPRPFLSRAGIAFFSWLTVLLSHQTIAVSESIRNDTRWWPWTGTAFSVIRHGITCGMLLDRDAARTALKPDAHEAYWIGMISELIPTKRVEDAVRAMQQVVKTHLSTRLVIIHDGPERARLARLIADLHLDTYVTLAGFRANAASFLNAFDLFIHTSQSEALGYALLEAGCASLPVIATDVGGIPEIIEDGVSGLLVPPFRPDVVAEKIIQLIRNPDQARALGDALHTRVITHFSPEKMLRDTFALYSAP